MDRPARRWAGRCPSAPKATNIEGARGPGKVETFDFAFGADDAYTVMELPDERAAAALALTVSGSGVARVRTVVLMTPEDLDAVAHLQPDYNPPGATS